MLLSIAFYSAVTALSYGIVTNVCKVVKLSKEIKELDKLAAEISKVVIKKTK